MAEKSEYARYIGIDAGSTTVKAVLVDRDGAIVAHSLTRVSGNYESDIACVRSSVLSVCESWKADPPDCAESPVATAATGYGQALVSDTVRTVSEISCHARGAHSLVPGARVVIDIGGQDMKIVSVNDRGKPVDFLMNDKCAAGTGRFLDVMARALGVDISQFADLAEASENAVRINSMCTVFAESEVISLLSRGVSKSDVANGLLDSVAERVVSMAKRLVPGIAVPDSGGSVDDADTGAHAVVMTGGGALNRALVASVSRRLGCHVCVPEHSQLAGALGAALIARDTASLR